VADCSLGAHVRFQIRAGVWDKKHFKISKEKSESVNRKRWTIQWPKKQIWKDQQ